MEKNWIRMRGLRLGCDKVLEVRWRVGDGEMRGGDYSYCIIIGAPTRATTYIKRARNLIDLIDFLQGRCGRKISVIDERQSP